MTRTGRSSTDVPPIRSAIVGAGLMGRWHADAAARVGGHLAAIVDSRIERAEGLAARLGADRAVASLEEIDPAEVDVVHVCTPSETHAALARGALLSGHHALVEKPLAPSAEETASLLALAEERRRILCPVHQVPFQPGALRVARARPRLGPVLHVDATLCTAGAGGAAEDERRRIAGEVLIHPLSLLARLVDTPIDAAQWRTVGGVAGEIRAVGAVNGTTVSLLVSTGGRPTTNEMRVIAERGTAHLDLFHGFAVLESGTTSRGRKIARPFALRGAALLAAGTNLARRAARREPAFPGLRELVRRFYDAVRASAPAGPVPPSEALAVARARDAILHAAANL